MEKAVGSGRNDLEVRTRALASPVPTLKQTREGLTLLEPSARIFADAPRLIAAFGRKGRYEGRDRDTFVR